MTLPGPTSNSFISQRLRLHYVDWGNPEAPPLILQHGGRDHCRSWDWVAEELQKDWHVIAPDLRGHGDSAWSPEGHYGMDAFVYDFAQLVHTLGFEQVTIVAHSLGGNIATRFAGLYPDKVRRLVTLDGLGPSPPLRSQTEPAGAYGQRQAVAGRQRGMVAGGARDVTVAAQQLIEKKHLSQRHLGGLRRGAGVEQHHTGRIKRFLQAGVQRSLADGVVGCWQDILHTQWCGAPGQQSQGECAQHDDGRQEV